MAARPRTLVRRIALVLTAFQLGAAALMPVLETLFRALPGPATIEAAHAHCAVVHQPATCPACAFAALRARPAERVSLTIAAEEDVAGDVAVSPSGPPRDPPSTIRTRAPPTLAA